MAEGITIEIVGKDGLSAPAKTARDALEGLRKATAGFGQGTEQASKTMPQLSRAMQEMQTRSREAASILGNLTKEYDTTGKVSKASIQGTVDKLATLHTSMRTSDTVAGLEAMSAGWAQTGRISQAAIGQATGSLQRLGLEAGMSRQEVAALTQQFSQMGGGMSRAMNEMRGQSAAASTAVSALTKEYDATGKVSKASIQGTVDKLATLHTSMRTGGTIASLEAMSSGWQQTGRISQGAIAQSVGTLQKLALEAGMSRREVATLTQQFVQASSAGVTMGERVSGAFRNMLQQATAFASGILIAGVIQRAIGGLGNAFIGLNSRLEQSEMAFTTMLGSGEKAKTFLDELAMFAAKTPFQFPELVDATKRMMAFGFKAEELIPLLTSVGNAAAAMGGGAFMINRITLALGQMQAKGKVSGEEMRQLAESGIPAWDMLAKKMGVEIPAAMKKVETSAVPAKIMIAAFQEGVKTRFGDMMAKQAQTFDGAMSTIRDSLEMTLAKGFKPFYEILSKATVVLANFLSSAQFQALADGVTSLTSALVGLAGIMLEHKEVQLVLYMSLSLVGTGYVLAAGKAASYALGVGLVTAATRTLTIAQAALNAAMLASPLTIIAAGLAGITVAAIWAYTNINQVKTAVDNLGRSLLDTAMGALTIEAQELRLLGDAALSTGQRLDEQDWGRRALDFMGKTLKNEAGNLDVLAAALGRATTKADEYAGSTKRGSIETNYLGDSVVTLHGAFKKADEALIPLNDDVQRMTLYLRPAEIAARNLAAANRDLAASILRVNEIEGTPYIEQTIDDLRREQQERRRYGETVEDTAGKLETLVARTKELSQANTIYGQGSAQSRAIMAQTAPLANQLKQSYSDLGATQRATVADAVGGFDSLVESLKRADEQLVKTAEGAVKKEMALATKDLSDKIRLAKGDLSQLRDVTKLYGEDSEEARTLTASLSGRLAELRSEYGNLDAVQRQQIDSLELEAQKLQTAASNFREVGFSVEQVTAALIAMHPATVAAAAQVATWRQRIADVTIAQQANSDQLKAAQKELQGMQEHLSGLNSQLSEAKQRFSDLTSPKLVGMGAFDKQITDLQDNIRKLNIQRLTVQMGGGDTKALDEQIKTLQDKLQLTELTKEDTFAKPLRALKTAAEGAAKELTFSQALQGITQSKVEIANLTAAIAGQEAAIRGQQSAINSIQAASEALNRTLAEYQNQLKRAEDRQNLVSQALQLSYKWLMDDRIKFVELGDEGVRQAGIIDEETRKLLGSVTGAAENTTTQSAEALAKMVEEYQKSMVQGIIAVQGSDGKGGLVGTNKILAESIDVATIKADGLRQALDSLQSKEITITTHYVSTYDTAGGGGIPAPEVGGAKGGWFRVPGFAQGGAFAVGGLPGIDSVGVAFRAKPGEIVNIQQPGQAGGGVVWTGDLIVQGSVVSAGDLAQQVRTELLRTGKRNGGTSRVWE